MISSDLDKATLDWMNTPAGEESLKSDMERKWSTFDDASCDEALRHKSYRALNRRLFRGRTRMRVRLARAAVAIAILSTVGAGGWFLLDGRVSQRKAQIKRYSDNVLLTLPDGSEIAIDRFVTDGPVAQHGGVSLRLEDGRLIHQNAARSASVSLQWGKVANPRGEKFEMTLEDGTRVWLNAGSNLRFPIAFAEGERRVMLEGEACFEVAKNAESPFIVTTPAQSITVLGTLFNVYAYQGAAAEYTTLAGGSVSLSTDSGGDRLIIAPGQQAVLSAGSGRFVVREVDADAVLAWRDGVFAFDGNTFGEVFFKLSRWYDFSYSFENDDLSRLTFSGNVRRYDDVKQIFDIIETIAQVRIEVNGNGVKINER